MDAQTNTENVKGTSPIVPAKKKNAGTIGLIISKKRCAQSKFTSQSIIMPALLLDAKVGIGYNIIIRTCMSHAKQGMSV